MKRIGLDIGFGFVKAVSIEGGKMGATVFPAALGQAQKLSSFDVGMGRRGRRTRVITYDGIEYYVGRDCLAHSRTWAARQDRFRIGSQEERLLALVALARLGVRECAIVAGLPWPWYDDRHKLKRSLVGEHRLTIGSKEHTITIHRVKVVPQPIGGFYCHFLDMRGLAIACEEEMLKTYGFLDIGWNTTDLTALRRLQPVERWSGGERIGVRRVIEIVDDHIRRQHGLELSPHEIDEVVKSRQVEIYGEAIDIACVVDSAIRAVAQQIRAKATALWGNGERFTRIFIFGGGATVMGKAIREAFPKNSEVLPQPYLANAIGFAKFAQRSATFRDL
jgi:plasmid segregation protein ParM